MKFNSEHIDNQSEGEEKWKREIQNMKND
jgi:hypothetical protein